MKKKFFLVFLLAIFWMSSPCFAQPKGPMMQKREQLQSLIQERLQQDLGLSLDQAKKFSEVMKKYHQKRRELREQMRSYRAQLETVSNSTDASQASQVVANLQKTRNEIENLEDAQFKEIKPMLSPQQQAKYFLVMENIRHEMMQIKQGKKP